MVLRQKLQTLLCLASTMCKNFYPRWLKYYFVFLVIFFCIKSILLQVINCINVLLLKKMSLVICCLMFVNIIYPLGLGGMVNINPGALLYDDSKNVSDFTLPCGVTFTLSDTTLPFIFCIETSYDVTMNNFVLGCAFDFPFYQIRRGNFHTFFSLGPAIGTTIEKDLATLDLKARATVCFSWDRYDGFLEPFLSVALEPAVAVDFVNNDYEVFLRVPVGVGIRVHD